MLLLVHMRSHMDKQVHYDQMRKEIKENFFIIFDIAEYLMKISL